MGPILVASLLALALPSPQNPPNETITIPGTDLKFEMVYVPGGKAKLGSADFTARAPQDVPDSLPKRDEGTDVMPDDVRRSDRSQRMPPDSLPPMDEQSIDRGEDPRRTR